MKRPRFVPRRNGSPYVEIQEPSQPGEGRRAVVACTNQGTILTNSRIMAQLAEMLLTKSDLNGDIADNHPAARRTSPQSCLYRHLAVWKPAAAEPLDSMGRARHRLTQLFRSSRRKLGLRPATKLDDWNQSRLTLR